MKTVLGTATPRTPRILWLLYGSSLFMRMAFGALFLIFDRLTGNNIEALAFVTLGYPFLEMAASSLVGVASDTVGKRHVLVFGIGLSALCFLAFAIGAWPWYLGVVYSILGIGAAAVIASSTAYIAQVADPADRGRQMGFFDYATIAGYVLGFVAGGAMLSAFDQFFPAWLSTKLTLIVLALILGATVILVMLWIPKDAKDLAGKGVTWRVDRMFDFSSFRSAWSLPTVRAILPIWLAFTTLLYLGLRFFPPWLETQGVSDLSKGLLIGGVGLFLTTPILLWGYLADRLGRLPVMFFGILNLTVVVLLLVIFPDRLGGLFRDGSGDWALLAFIGALTLGVTAFVPAALAAMADHATDENRGSVMALYSFALGFGAAFGSIGAVVLAFFLDDQGIFTGIMWFSVVLVVIAFLLLLRYTYQEIAWYREIYASLEDIERTLDRVADEADRLLGTEQEGVVVGHWDELQDRIELAFRKVGFLRHRPEGARHRQLIADKASLVARLLRPPERQPEDYPEDQSQG